MRCVLGKEVGLLWVVVGALLVTKTLPTNNNTKVCISSIGDLCWVKY